MTSFALRLNPSELLPGAWAAGPRRSVTLLVTRLFFDYVDEQVPMLRRMFERRLRGYRAIGYEQGEVPRGFELLADPDYLFDEGRDERYEEDDDTEEFDAIVASGDS